jgi:hypothetical protein
MDEHGCRPLHHPDHPRRREDREAKRSANIRQQPTVDLELMCGFDPDLERHAPNLPPADFPGRATPLVRTLRGFALHFIISCRR